MDNGFYERITFDEIRRVAMRAYTRVTSDDVQHAAGRFVRGVAHVASVVGEVLVAHATFFSWVIAAVLLLRCVAGATQGGVGSALVAPSGMMGSTWTSPGLDFGSAWVAPSSPPPSPPLSPPSLSVDKAPRTDYLTHAQATQLHCELLAGNEVPANMPESITKTIAIADTGCAR